MKMGSLYAVAALFVFTALSKGELPEDDFRIISIKDLLSMDSDVFSDNVTRSFSQLLFDVARDQVIVGARDVLLRVSLRALLPLERADWPAPIDKVNLCQDKGQTEEDCHNYVKVLLSFGHKLFACGTNAFSPICSWREIESIKTETEQTEATALCPHNPHSNVTALLSSTGEYYAGTPTNFASSDNAICRSRGASLRNTAMLRTQQYDLSWLNEPQFVGSFEDDQFVYFVFREMAVEFLNCGKAIYSRIARVCKNDSGGHLVMRNNWSTFIKARLSCAVDGEGGVLFYYNEVQSVEYIPSEGLLVATFTTPGNGIPGSAICIYNMSSIHKAFDGPFKVQDSPTSTWEQRIPSDQAKRHFKCERDDRPHQSIEYQRYHLMYNSIEPIIGKPTYKLNLQRFIHLTVDVTTTHLGNQLVVYVSTEESDVLKLIVMKNYQTACLVERWRLGRENMNVLTMQFVKETNSVYIGTERSILRVSHSHCDIHTSRSACLSAYCEWLRGRCVYTERGFDGDTCYTPVDGGWSSWSSWEPCMQDSSQSLYTEEKPDMCMCRRRTCNSPKPSNGGLGCVGASIAVTNCTVHGGWSSWSAWGACSSSCGIAVKSRRRLCSSPEPSHGGRLCVGEDTQDIYCSNLPPCADEALAPIDGGWSQWSSWSTCTSIGPACGPAAGFKERRRVCNNPPPKNGGLECEGSKSERQTCDLRPCEIRKATAWTPWVHVPGNTSDGSYTEKRFKFLCKAPSPEQLRLTMAREEDRYCTAQGSCSSSPILEEGWGPWGAWGPCSASCEGGQQRRERECVTGPCVGANSVMRACNTEPCRDVWSCWSEWSPCAGGCGAGGAGGAGAGTGAGRRSRTRGCVAAEGCAGADLQTALCINQCTGTESGWGEWGEWSECNNNERIRKRSCEAGACVGAQVQVAACDDLNNELYALPAYSSNIEVASFVNLSRDCLSVGGIVGVTIAAFVIGVLITLAGVIYCQRRGRLPWKRHPRVPSSPHYITAKQNSYVTVPLKDVPRKAKRQPSFTGISGSSGILLSKSNNISNPNNQNNTTTTPKLYPKAIANEYDSMGTLRRHSNQPRNHFDFEEEKFY